MNIAISEFLQGFGPGFLFSGRRRPGAATQVFATEDVPCDEEVQQTADTYITENALIEKQFYETRTEIFDAIFPDIREAKPQNLLPPIELTRAKSAFAEIEASLSHEYPLDPMKAKSHEYPLDSMKAKAKSFVDELAGTPTRGLVGSKTHPALRIHLVSMMTLLIQTLDRIPTVDEQIRLQKALRKLAESVGVSASELGLAPTEQDQMMERFTKSSLVGLPPWRKHHHDV